MNNNFKKTLASIALAGALSFSNQVFSATGLFEIYQLAASHDAKLAQQKAIYEASLQNLDIARAPLLPQLSADGSYSVNDSNQARGDVNTRSLGINFRQSLYEHDVWSRYDQAKYIVKQAEYAIKEAEQDIIVRVAEQYFQVLLAQEDVKLALAKEKADQTQWDRASASAEVGLASKTDVLQTKSSFDLSKSDRISAENNLDIAYEQLMKLTGVEIKALKVIALNVKLPPISLDINQYAKKAEQNNLTVLQAVEQANASGEEIEVQKAGHWFKVDFRAGYNDKDYSGFTANSAASYKDRTDFNMGVYASIPLYSGGLTSASVSKARANYKASNASLRDAKETARLNARIQVRNVLRGLELVAANRAAVQSNDAFLEAAEESYKVGLQDLLEVLTARTNKFQARRNLASSLHNVVLSRLKLEAAVGSLSAENLINYESILSDPVNNTTLESIQ